MTPDARWNAPRLVQPEALQSGLFASCLVALHLPTIEGQQIVAG